MIQHNNNKKKKKDLLRSANKIVQVFLILQKEIRDKEKSHQIVICINIDSYLTFTLHQQN